MQIFAKFKSRGRDCSEHASSIRAYFASDTERIYQTFAGIIKKLLVARPRLHRLRLVINQLKARDKPLPGACTPAQHSLEHWLTNLRSSLCRESFASPSARDELFMIK